SRSRPGSRRRAAPPRTWRTTRRAIRWAASAGWAGRARNVRGRRTGWSRGLLTRVSLSRQRLNPRRSARISPGPVLAEQTPADDRLLDLAGALPDQQERRLPHQALDLVLLRVAVAPVDAERLLRHLRAVLARQVLGHARLDVVALAGVLEPRRVHHHQVRGLHLGRHLRQLERDGPVLRDRLAERRTLLGVLHRQLERPDRDPARPRGHVHPPDLD